MFYLPKQVISFRSVLTVASTDGTTSDNSNVVIVIIAAVLAVLVVIVVMIIILFVTACYQKKVSFQSCYVEC